MRTLKKIYKSVNYKGVVVMFLLLFIYSSISFSSKNFFSYTSVTNLLHKSVLDGGFMAIGISVVLLTGGIDLSVGSVLALSGLVCAMATPAGPVIAILAGLCCGAICGLINGVLVAKFKVIPFIGTFATQLAVRAVGYTITNYGTIRVDDGGVFTKIANSDLFGMPTSVIIFFVLILLFAYISSNTKFGMRLYAVGGNEEAAKMMGMNTDSVKITAYVICSLFASLNGVLMTSRMNAGASVSAEGWEMTAIACAALGGVKLSGGEGKFGGAMFGVLVVGLINTVFNYQGNINTWWRNIIMGSILLFSVLIQSDIIKISRRKTIKKLA